MGLENRSGFVTLEGLEQEVRTLLKRITASIGSWVRYKSDSREPTGFVDKADVSLSFDNGTRRLTVEPAVTSFKFWYQGVEFTKLDAETIDLPGSAEGIHLIYYDADGVLQQVANPSHAQTHTAIKNYCLVAYIYFDEDNNLGQLATELHGMAMDNETHLYLHETFGARYDSGFAPGDFVISDGTDNEDAQFSVATGIAFDEDLEFEMSAIAKLTGCEIWYRDGVNWRWTTEAGFSVQTTGTGRLAWDDGGVLTEVTDGKYVLCHIIASHLGQDGEIIAVTGQNEYANVADARDGAEVEMASLATPGTMLKEGIPVATIIFQTKNTYGNSVKAKVVQTSTGENYIDWRTSALTGGVSAGDHGLLAGLGDDDHTQYILHSLATAENDFLVASGANTYVKKTLAETGAILETDIDHGNIQGLANDDHEQYLLVDGSRVMTGALTIQKALNNRLLIEDTGAGTTFPGLELKHTDITWTIYVDGANDDLIFYDGDPRMILYNSTGILQLSANLNVYKGVSGRIRTIDTVDGTGFPGIEVGHTDITWAMYIAGASDWLGFNDGAINALILYSGGGVAIPVGNFTMSGGGKIYSGANVDLEINSDARMILRSDEEIYLDYNEAGGSDTFNIRRGAGYANVLTITSTGYISIHTIKAGATQAGATASANQLWKTSGHATLPDNVVMIGV